MNSRIIRLKKSHTAITFSLVLYFYSYSLLTHSTSALYYVPSIRRTPISKSGIYDNGPDKRALLHNIAAAIYDWYRFYFRIFEFQIWWQSRQLRTLLNIVCFACIWLLVLLFMMYEFAEKCAGYLRNKDILFDCIPDMQQCLRHREFK